MAISNEQLLSRALRKSDGSLVPSAFTGQEGDPGTGTATVVGDAAKQLLVDLAAEQAMLSEVRTVFSNSPSWTQNIVSFASRIMRLGVPNEKGAVAAPDLGSIKVETSYLKSIVGLAEESTEDLAMTGDLAADTMSAASSQIAFEIEEWALGADSGDSGDYNPYSADDMFMDQDGWLKRAVDNANAFDATSDGQDLQTVMKKLLTSLGDRYKRAIEADGRYWMPRRTVESWRDILSNRGTALGDLSLQGNAKLSYQGIDIVAVPAFPILSDKSFVLLGNRNSFLICFQRKVRVDAWHDVLGGTQYFVTTLRGAPRLAINASVAVAYNFDVSL